jgi:hypothetical protein
MQAFYSSSPSAKRGNTAMSNAIIKAYPFLCNQTQRDKRAVSNHTSLIMFMSRIGETAVYSEESD